MWTVSQKILEHLINFIYTINNPYQNVENFEFPNHSLAFFSSEQLFDFNLIISLIRNIIDLEVINAVIKKISKMRIMILRRKAIKFVVVDSLYYFSVNSKIIYCSKALQ